METDFTRALDAGDGAEARRVLEQLAVRARDLEPETVTGTFVTRHAASLDAIEHAARSWEVFDRLCERCDDDWSEDVTYFLDASGLVDWGHDHLFVRDRRVAAFSRDNWDRHGEAWMHARGVDPARAKHWCRVARGFDL